MNRVSSPSPLSPRELVDEYFIENRTKLLEIAAFLDRLDRADPSYAGTKPYVAPHGSQGR